MSLLIKMYRTSQYSSFAEAFDQGGLYSFLADMADKSDVNATPLYGGGFADAGVLDNILIAMVNMADMYDGGYHFKVQVADADTGEVLKEYDFNSRGAVPSTSSEPCREEIGDPTPIGAPQ